MTKLFALLTATLLFAAQPAFALEWGKDYIEITLQPTSAKKGQVEVLEFFWYGCPHCYHLEPELEAWLQKKPKNVVFKRVPGVLGDGWLPLTRAYYALEVTGLSSKLHRKLFAAIHQERLDLGTPGAFLDWAAKNGADRKKLENAYNSFSVDTKVMRSQQLTRDYKLNGVPAFAVAGKYTTSAYLTGGVPQTFKVLDALIAQESKPARKGK